MDFKTYIEAIKTFRKDGHWNYSPTFCESHLCCSVRPIEHVLIHGTIELNGHREPIQLCADCVYQIENNLYDLKMERHA